MHTLLIESSCRKSMSNYKTKTSLKRFVARYTLSGVVRHVIDIESVGS